MESEAYEITIVCPSVSASCVIAFEPASDFFYEIHWGGQAIEGDLDAIPFNLVATISKWRMFK
jgi:hypothetical protein